MKSLRKIAVCTCALLVSMPALFFGTQAAQHSFQQPPAPAGSSSQPAVRQSQAPPLSDAQARITVNSNLVILPVTVKDRSGNLVPDLRKDEFRVFEDNVEQNIDVFSSNPFPLSMVILIDNDLKDKDAEQVQASLDAIVGGMSAEDEAFVRRADQFFHQVKCFTNDQDKLQTELKRTTLSTEPSVGPPGGPFSGSPTINNHSATDQSSIDKSTQIIKGQPTKALDDAVYAAAALLHDRPRSRRRIIVLISDGINGKKFNTFTYDNVIKTLQHDNISVYSIAVPSAYLDRKISPIDRTVSALIRYANDSGGEIFHATKEHSFEEFYSRLTEEARHQYTLAYVPRGSDRSSDYHTIEVRVKREGVDVRSRQGYFTGQIPTAKRP